MLARAQTPGPERRALASGPFSPGFRSQSSARKCFSLEAFNLPPHLPPSIYTSTRISALKCRPSAAPDRNRARPHREPGTLCIRQRGRPPHCCPSLCPGLIPAIFPRGNALRALGPDAGDPTLAPHLWQAPPPSLFSRALAGAGGARAAPWMSVSVPSRLLLSLAVVVPSVDLTACQGKRGCGVLFTWTPRAPGMRPGPEKRPSR